MSPSDSSKAGSSSSEPAGHADVSAGAAQQHDPSGVTHPSGQASGHSEQIHAHAPTAVLDEPAEPSPWSGGYGAYPPQQPPVGGFGHHPPSHEAARDRIWPHLVWELLLAVGVAVLFLVYRHHGSPGFTSDDYKPVWWWASMLGLLAMGFSLSLRVGAPNLAVGSMFLGGAVLSSMVYRKQDWAVWPSIATAVAIAAVAGLLLGAVIAVLHVPAWAASLGAGLAVLAWAANEVSNDMRVALAPHNGPDLFGYWEWVFVGIAGVSVLGGAVGVSSTVRSWWSVPAKSDPATRPGAGGTFASLVGLAVSSAMAAGAGGLLWIGLKPQQFSSAVSAFAEPGSSVMGLLFNPGGLIVLVLATALLGGVSAFGRRGGIFGTMLATLAMTLLVAKPVFHFDRPYSYMYLIAGVLLLGLVVTRVMEAACTRTEPPLQPTAQPQLPYPGW